MDVNDQQEAAPPAAAVEPRRCRIQFTGTGQEYFRIWIVNLLLTIVTLGIYSAWAKVRKLQYFYRNTHLDGSVFDYHGNPVAILKGRLLAVLLLVLYKVTIAMLGAYALIAVLAVMGAVPWLLAQSYRFRLHNSGYRGLRFRFAGPVWQPYLFFGLPMILALTPSVLIAAGVAGDPQHPNPRFFIGMGVAYLALALLWPYLHFSFKRWQHGHALYGTARASFVAHAGSFYGSYLLAAAILFAAVAAMTMLMVMSLGISAAVGHGRVGGVVGAVGILTFYGALLALVPFVTARLQNVVWSNTRLAGIGFGSDVRAGRLIGITFGNLVMVMFSLGLLIPFALIRLMKYKIESIEVLDADALTRFVGEGKGAEVGTAGEGAVDVMDLDFGL